MQRHYKRIELGWKFAGLWHKKQALQQSNSQGKPCTSEESPFREMPDIKVHASTEWRYKQSKFYPNVPKVPFRMMTLAPSGGGKTTLIVDVCVRLYDGVFSNIWVFSPTCVVDTSWDVVRKYVQNKLCRDPREHFFETFHEDILQGIIDKSLRITQLARDRNIQPQPSALIVLDDIADNPQITRKSRAVQTLAVRGRHAGYRLA